MITIPLQSTDVSDDSDEPDFPVFSGPSTTAISNSIRKPQTFSKAPNDNHSDSEESFASLHSDDVDLSDDEDGDGKKDEPSEK